MSQSLIRSWMVDNPVVRREARLRFWRRWRGSEKAVAVVGLAGVLSGLAVVSWDSAAFLDGAQRDALMIAYGVAMAIVAALMGARAVSGEREVRTWEQVRITRLRPVHVIVGKIAGVLWQMMFVIAVSAPPLWVWLTHLDLTAYSWPGGGPPTSTAHWVMLVVLAPAYSAVSRTAYSVPIGLLWVFTGALLWTVQGATIGVFASLRYRSSITSGAVAMLLLGISLFLDVVFAGWTGYIISSRPESLSVTALGIITAVGVWAFPWIPILITFGLAVYEFPDFDSWLQANEARAGR